VWWLQQTSRVPFLEVVDEPTLQQNKPMSRANMDKNPAEVAAMFDAVAKRYDLVNDILSLGQTKRWRKATTTTIAPMPGMKILDLAAGTGSSSEPLHKAGADVISADFSEGMLEAGRRARPHLKFMKADALNLPFENESFDVVTISFGLRNTSDIDKALTEAKRVTKKGGSLVVAEFSSPTFKPFRIIYINYLMKALPAIASKTSSNPEAYVYLAESIRAWPNQAALAARITQAGWSQVGWRNLSGGVVAVHRGINS
jgi:demethylmenaquinone methyltransferase/2-methoxy-6-polyprenyl-1,4-benzoquinol methylase